VKQVRIHGPGRVALDDVPAPDPGPHDAVVRVKACGICGSDLGYVAIGGLAGPGPEPMPLGHEFSAVVERVGAEVHSIEPGARVVVNPIAPGNSIGNGGDTGAFSPEVLVRDVDRAGVIFPIPDALPFDQAALVEPLGVGMHAVDRAAVSPSDRVTIFGAGPIGLMSLATLHHRGFEDVVIVDLSDTRLGIAKELGATLTLHAERDDVWARIRELHGTELFLGVVPTAGSDAYIEASGAPGVIADVISKARPGARVSVVALHRTPQTVDFVSLMAKQITIAGSMAYPDDYGEMIRMLGEVDLSPAITHRFALADFDEALATAQDAGRSGKVLVEP
jgi:threonine dehydrogenase-like Zn-dependent dehydrogenase